MPHLRLVPAPATAPLRALIYARTSKDRAQRGKATSSQVEACNREAAERGWVVVDTIVDDDQPGSSYARHDREGWQVAIAAIEAGACDVLLAWEFSRATRDLEVFVALRKVLEKRGVLLSYHGDLYDLRKAGDRRRVGHDAVDAEAESGQTSERVLRTKASDAERGWPAGPIPFGYRRVYDPRSGVLVRQEPDEPEGREPGTAPIVRELVERFLDGASLNSLALDMGRRGIPTPKPPRDPERARGWTAATVGQLLRQPAIAGLRVHRRPGEPVAFFDAAWVGIITREQRDRMQVILSDPARVIHRGIEPTHLMSHLAVCGLCGVPVRHRVKSQKAISYPAYVCDHTGCRGVYVQAPPVDDLVTQAVLTVLGDPRSVAALRGDTTSSVAAREAARRRIAELEADVAELDAERATNGMRAVVYARALGPLEDQLAEARAATTIHAAGPIVLRLATSADHAAAWAGFTVADRRDVIRALFDVRLHPAAVKGTRRWDPRRVELIPHAPR